LNTSEPLFQWNKYIPVEHIPIKYIFSIGIYLFHWNTYVHGSKREYIHVYVCICIKIYIHIYMHVEGCGRVSVQQSETVRRCNCLQLRVTAIVCHRNCASLQLCATATVRHCNCVSLQLCVTATVHHCNCASLQLCVAATACHGHCLQLSAVWKPHLLPSILHCSAK